jgi:hypothetical protein
LTHPEKLGPPFLLSEGSLAGSYYNSFPLPFSRYKWDILQPGLSSWKTSEFNPKDFQEAGLTSSSYLSDSVSAFQKNVTQKTSVHH